MFYTITSGVKSCLVVSGCLDSSSKEKSSKTTKWSIWDQIKYDLGLASSRSPKPAGALSAKARNDLLVHDLNRLSHKEELRLNEHEHQRTRRVKGAFHDAFVSVSKEEIRKRPYIPDETECKDRCEEEPNFREGYQEGVSMSLAILGQSVRAFHQEALSDRFCDKRWGGYRSEMPAFEITKTGQEMLSRKLGRGKEGLFTE